MKLLRKFQNLFRRQRLEAEMAEEMRAHLELQAERLKDSGMTAEEARFAAQRQFGNLPSIQERAREGRGGVWLEQCWQDVRYSARALAKTPAFTMTVWGTLVVGIGLAAAVIGLTAPTLFAPQADGLQLIGFKDKRNSFTPLRTGLHWEAYREQLKSFSGFAAVFRENKNVLIQGRPILADVVRASHDCFSTLGIQPALGRTFAPDEHRPGASTEVVILSGHFWRQYFHADPNILGREISIGQRTGTVIGVFDANASFPPPFAGDLYLPLAFRSDPANPLFPMLHIVGRLRSGVTVAQAEAELATVKLPEIPAWAANFFADQKTVLQKPWEISRPETQWVVLLAALLLYALACLNAMNLMLVRLLRRRQEFGIRLALGGSRWRVARLLLLEGLGLATLAGLTVLVAAHGISLPSSWPSRSARSCASSRTGTVPSPEASPH